MSQNAGKVAEVVSGDFVIVRDAASGVDRLRRPWLPLSAEFMPCHKCAGKVAEVVSGDCVIVRDAASGVERRINLSSVRAPRVGTRDRAHEPYAVEAKDFLRKKLIGRDVNVKMEYTRKVGGWPSLKHLCLLLGIYTASSACKME